ncbi:MAG: hypothetical protein JWO86_7837 [Myxococcaceae bacterium]|nr:hypothetical protein [Myxococcaceae bacterium]
MKIASSSALAFAILAGAAVLVPGAASAEQPKAGAAPPISTVAQPTTSIGGLMLASIPLGCSGAGHSDVTSRNHTITNTAGHPIPKGTILSWSANNKGSGHVTLSSDLAPNATVAVIEPGQTNGYTCTASFVPPNVDLVVTNVKWTSDTAASVTVSNLSPWRDAGASTLRLQRMKCLSSSVSSTDAATPAIAKGSSTTVNLTAAKAGVDYLEATANVASSVAETNHANNTNKSLEFGSNKSCTPQ